MLREDRVDRQPVDPELDRSSVRSAPVPDLSLANRFLGSRELAQVTFGGLEAVPEQFILLRPAFLKRPLEGPDPSADT
jgi:hypothetical protein